MLPAIPLIIGIFLNPALAHRHLAYNHDESLATDRSTWMKPLPSSTPLHEISMTGTHDTMAFYGGFTTQTQSVPLSAQLRGGIRALDIRCRYYKNSFPIHHGIVFQNAYFSDVLKTIVDFLSKNPSETVLMRFRDEYESGKNTKGFWDIYEDYVQPYKNKFIWQPTTSRPTLGEVRGRIVIMDDYTRLNESSNITITRYGISYANKSEFKIQDLYEISTIMQLPKKWAAVKEQLIIANSNKGSAFYVNYLSAASVPTGVFPYFVASGHITDSTNSDRLFTGLTDPLGKSVFGNDFPRINCVFGICMYYFEGTNILIYEYILKEKVSFVGIVYADFPGDGLIDVITNLNSK